MTKFEGDIAQGGLPSLKYGESHLWLVEIESFPPIYKIFVSNGEIASEVFKSLTVSKEIKDLRNRYQKMAESLEKIPKDFFWVPVNIIALCSITTSMKDSYKSRAEAVLKISANAFPNLSIRWPANLDLINSQLAFTLGRIALYNGSRDFYVADLEDISEAFEANIKIVEAA